MEFPFSFCLILVCATAIVNYPFSCAGNNETDWLALRDIKARIANDPLNIMSSWNETLHFCEWRGVYCSHQHQRVTALDLQSLKLTGTLSPFIGNLSFLRLLRLQNNSFFGEIPSEIGRLHRLQYLLLSNNSIEGGIPSNISGCSNLIQLSIGGNQMVGEIPPELGLLSSLQLLVLPYNNLTGTFPSSLTNLTSLSKLSVTQNSITGTIPDSIGSLKNLTFLALSLNQLSGTIPLSLFNLSSLAVLGLGENQFEGSLPDDLGTLLPNLQFMSIMFNQFTGSIPVSISNASNLGTLEMGFNNLQGQVPSLEKLERLERLVLSGNALGIGQSSDLDFVLSLANASILDTFEIGVNNFSGTFPNIICNFSLLLVLEINMNEIAGQIPNCIQQLTKLTWFKAEQNQLSGAIPSSITKLQNLERLDLVNNQLSGYIPSSIGNLTRLDTLLLSQNSFIGHIPQSLGNCRYLLELQLDHNNLTGAIPSQLLSLSSLTRVLNLSNNPLSGSLAAQVGELRNLVALDVSNALLSGEIPITLGSCVELQYIYMSGNRFVGTIPSALITLKGLVELDLSRNYLSGKIPKFLANLPLKRLNVSYNSLEGEVLTGGGIFSNATGLSVVGNYRLCGGMPELKLPPCKPTTAQRKQWNHTRRLITAILSAIFGLFILSGAFAMLYAFWFKKRMLPKAEPEHSHPSLSYQSLLKATNGFSSENMIGSGTYGVVYKGALNEDQSLVAVKVFNSEPRAASKSFIAECQVLRNIKHRNLLKVITACSSVDYQGNDFKALIYEYMVNGSLEDWLHQMPTNTAAGTSNNTPRNLNLLQRLDIAVDVALALEYLHHHCGTSIVHCDLKPSNVLLDHDMVAHLGDFGLAKILSEGIKNSQANQSSSFGVRGTIGYAPPEYGMGNEPSTNGDVYSYGILLLEMFTGRKPTDSMLNEGQSLRGLVKAALPEGLMEILDHALVKDTTLNSCRRGYSEFRLNALDAILEIALSCSAQLPKDRMHMTHVAAKLSSIRNNINSFPKYETCSSISSS